MPDLFQAFNSTCPALTPQTVPVTALSVGASTFQVVKVTIVIPAGHAGLTGIQLWYGGGPAIPYLSGWFSGDDDVIPIILGADFPVGVPWSVAMMNQDVQAHSWQTRWEMDYVAAGATPSANQAAAVSDIYTAASTLTAAEA